MKIRLVTWGLATVLASTGCAAAASAKCSVLRYEPRMSISGSEFHVLTTGDEFGPNNRTNFRVWGFDYEQRPMKKGWSAVALVQGATPDLGVTPVTGVVWLNRSAETQAPLSYIAPDDNTLVLQEARPPKGCKPAALTLSQRGDQVFADGKLVGTIQSP